ncbi:hypothetical protein KC319_g29 [Hortaea werneckii]|nr:hypothetical protein KC319_g29 [Hortaea werneckii]
MLRGSHCSLCRKPKLTPLVHVGRTQTSSFKKFQEHEKIRRRLFTPVMLDGFALLSMFHDIRPAYVRKMNVCLAILTGYYDGRHIFGLVDHDV